MNKSEFTSGLLQALAEMERTKSEDAVAGTYYTWAHRGAQMSGILPRTKELGKLEDNPLLRAIVEIYRLNQKESLKAEDHLLVDYHQARAWEYHEAPSLVGVVGGV